MFVEFIIRGRLSSEPADLRTFSKEKHRKDKVVIRTCDDRAFLWAKSECWMIYAP